jgi:hypothetical protein
LLVFAAEQPGEAGYAPFVFELAGASVAVVTPRVRARVRRLDSIFRVVRLCFCACVVCRL